MRHSAMKCTFVSTLSLQNRFSAGIGFVRLPLSISRSRVTIRIFASIDYVIIDFLVYI